MKSPDGFSGVVFDERTVQGAISTVLPKAPLSAREAIKRVFGGLFPFDDAVRVPAEGRSATSMVRAMLQDLTSDASRNAVPLLETYMGTYGVVSPDDERLRSRAGMAIGKVVVALRQRGHPVGVACATVEGTILAVPYYIDPWAPDPR